MSDEVLNRIVVGALVALLIVIAIVGLVSGKLDPTAALVALCTLIGGVIAGQSLRKRDGKDDKP